MSFQIHTTETAPEKSKEILEVVKSKLGFIPNLYAVMAESPELLQAYLSISELIDKTSFSPTERQIVLITASYVNNCDYCVAAHSVISSMQKVPNEIVAALRENRPLADGKLEALRKFAYAAIEKRGFIAEEEKQNFLAAGYTNRNILEVILAAGLKTLSNYTNHIAEIDLDPAFETARWKKAAAA